MAGTSASHAAAATEESEPTVALPCEDRPPRPPVRGYSPSANGEEGSEYTYA